MSKKLDKALAPLANVLCELGDSPEMEADFKRWERNATMTSPFSDELVRAVAKALCDYSNQGVPPEAKCHWSSFVEGAKVALLARKQFKRDRRAELDRLVREAYD